MSSAAVDIASAVAAGLSAVASVFSAVIAYRTVKIQKASVLLQANSPIAAGRAELLRTLMDRKVSAVRLMKNMVNTTFADPKSKHAQRGEILDVLDGVQATIHMLKTVGSFSGDAAANVDKSFRSMDQPDSFFADDQLALDDASRTRIIAAIGTASVELDQLIAVEFNALTVVR